MTTGRSLSFADFDRRAESGDRLSLVFLGGSLTWGANSTDPQLRSYRTLIENRFRERHIHTPFQFWDAAIGGQGSQLGIFRLERDVLSRKPDLLFLEFAVNDGASDTDEERLSSFEALVRRVINEAGCPVLISIMAVRDDLLDSPPARPRHEAHKVIAKAYGCPLADTVALVRARVRSGAVALQDIWCNPAWPNPKDAVHPGNRGYELYSEAIWQTYLEAVKGGAACRTPQTTLHPSTYLQASRFRLAGSAPSLAGWKVGQPDRSAAAYDFLMSRWLDDLLIARATDGNAPSALTLRLRGQTVLIYGEATPASGSFRVTIDGKLSPLKDGAQDGLFDAAARGGGNTPLVRVIARDLSPGDEHTLQLEPVLAPGQELKLESICVAGPGAHARFA